MSHHHKHHHNNNFNNQENQPIIKKDENYSFLRSLKSSEKNNTKAIYKGITAGLKVFVRESPDPITSLVKDTMREIFS